MELCEKNNMKQSNKTLHHSSTSTKHLERKTITQHLLYAFLPKQHFIFVWPNSVMIVLCHRLCYIKDIGIYIVIQKVNTFAEKHGSPQESSPLWEFRPSKVSAIFFSGVAFYSRLGTYSQWIVNWDLGA